MLDDERLKGVWKRGKKAIKKKKGEEWRVSINSALPHMNNKKTERTKHTAKPQREGQIKREKVGLEFRPEDPNFAHQKQIPTVALKRTRCHSRDEGAMHCGFCLSTSFLGGPLCGLGLRCEGSGTSQARSSKESEST